jgi:hypothetical protein
MSGTECDTTVRDDHGDEPGSPELNEAAAALAAADADAFRAEGPRIDARIGTLLTLVLGALASSGFIGGIGASVSRQRRAYLAMGLLAVSALVIVAGLVLIVGLILPRLSKVVTARSGVLARVSVLPDEAAVRAHYLAAAQDRLAYQSFTAWRHAAEIARRFHRVRTAGRVLLVGVALAALGFLALGWGW